MSDIRVAIKNMPRLPALRVGSRETYAQFRVREKRRNAERRDAMVVYNCMRYPPGTAQGRLLRAFYGVEMRFIQPEWFK